MTSSQISMQEVLKRIAAPAHDATAEERLCQEYQEKISWLVQRGIGSHPAAKDIAQNVIIALLETARRDGFAAAQNPSKYIYGFCKNKVNDELRKLPAQKGTSSIDGMQDGLIDTAENPFDKMITTENRVEDRVKVARALRKLTIKKRKALWLRYVWGWEYEAIGQNLSMSYDAARKTVSEGRKMFAREFGKRH